MNEPQEIAPETSNRMLFLACVIIGGLLIALAVRINKSNQLLTNEEQAAAACKAYAEAQEMFHRTDWDGDGILEYTPKMFELWETKPGTGNVGLISADFAAADCTLPNPKPNNGYLFKALHSRIVDGKSISYLNSIGDQTRGYALIAFPAQYMSTGVNTFTISSNGTIYQNDLGPDTAKIASKKDLFDHPPIDWGHHAE